MSQKFYLLKDTALPAGHCPYRLLDPKRREVAWISQFLDVQCLRGLSLCSLRIYGYDLLNFARWWLPQRRKLSGLDQHALLDYVRFQLQSSPPPNPSTINHRLTVVRCLYRFCVGHDLPTGPRCVTGSHKPARRSVMENHAVAQRLSDSNSHGGSSCRSLPSKWLASGRASAPFATSASSP
jgi:hypothetical protein